MFPNKYLLRSAQFASAAAVLISQAAWANVQLGNASVLSQQGQRLKMAVAYDVKAGERAPLLRFTVDEVQVPEGYRKVSARGFTMTQGENSKVIFLQSAEIFDAPEVTVALRVANQPDGFRVYRVAVPPAQAATVVGPSPEASTKATPKRGGKKNKRTYKRKIVAQDNLPPK